MKRILFPTEFSPNAVHNFYYALDWAKKFNADLVVMHALKQSEGDRTGQKSWEEIGEEFKDKMKNFVATNLSPAYHAVNIEYEIEIGFPVESIERQVSENNIDMIVMGMEAHKTALEAYFSSVAMDIISTVQVPVLLIPNTSKFEVISNMTYTFNFEFEELGAILNLLQFNEITQSTLTCLHVLESDENKQEMQYKFDAAFALFKNHKRYGDNVHLRMTSGIFEQIIDSIVKEESVDMLVMLSNRRDFTARFMEPSTASKVARKMDIPVLILKHDYFFKNHIQGSL